jgi:hypothetical protein
MTAAPVLATVSSVAWGFDPNAVVGLPNPVERRGRGVLRFLGFKVYDAELWAAPLMTPTTWAQHPLALVLTYAVSTTGANLTERTLDEMRRMEPLPADRQAAWEAALSRGLPDVKAGDRLTGAWSPEGVLTLHSAARVQRIDDRALAQRFFAVWLDERTSQPALRRALLGLSA